MMRVLLDEYGYEAVIAASVSDALERAKSGGLALCILDHWITEGNGIELCQQIRAFDSSTPIMFYSGAGYEADIQKGLAAGAQAYLLKGMSHLKLLEAIRSVHAGQQYIPRSILNSIPGKLNRSALSPRELDILRLVAKGLNNHEIAAALNITRGTVKWHVNIILRRLDVRDRTQAVIVAAQRGIIEL